MTDHIDALTGTLEIQSTPPTGTTIKGTIPTGAEVPTAVGLP